MVLHRSFFQKLFWISLSILLIGSLMPGNGSILNPLDKVAHFLFYFLLSIPITALLSKSTKLILGLCLAVILGITIEFIQEYIPGRGYDIWDIIANSLGVIAGAIFFIWKKENIYNVLNQKNK